MSGASRHGENGSDEARATGHGGFRLWDCAFCLGEALRVDADVAAQRRQQGRGHGFPGTRGERDEAAGSRVLGELGAASCEMLSRCSGFDETGCFRASNSVQP